ncbi:S9 family peptidase [Parasphingorhabdus halotolerans]|uniref:S9 family peptidase n=1 Tax=Parasphingorhabdus halotolerans TaxID=2725558 RepID=A0A6H2DPC9_9SPHN|nr:S9 family peptidase [Parasphingorhabdus halotolerans]QJB70240.1 S9 family peptidase [Parasphingorhabdus halotolerans]
MTETKATPMTSPPIAEQRPHSYERHGYTIEDPYFWLKDQSYPTVDDEDVLEYLKAENQWFQQNMAAQKPLTDELFTEMKARIKEDESSVPQKDGDWMYWTAFDEGAQYKKWYRKSAWVEDEDRLILDENELAKGKDYFRLGAFSVSPDGKLLAYAYDDNGSERFEAHIRDLATGEDLPDVIPGTLSSLVWSADSKCLLYGLANENWRTDNARLHVLGTDIKDDIELYKEEQDGFTVGIGLTHSEKFIAIATGDNETSEVRLVPTDNPRAEPILISPRKKGREYSVEEHDDTLYILTNDDHVNFRLASAKFDNPGEWSTLIAGSDEFYLTDMTPFKDFFVTEGRENGLDQVEIRSYDAPTAFERIAFPEASYNAGLDDNPEFDVSKMRLSYESMVTPDTVYDYSLAGKSLETLKVQEIPSGYDASEYTTERLTIKARDGAMVPASLVYKNGTKLDGSAPLHLYAYGAYGYAVPPSFSTSRLSLVDRGFIYAIAHIRGGDDLGRNWYLQGKLMQRENTFNDFVDVAKGLIDKGYTSKGSVTASGGSAGGELMGAIVNSDPDLWGAVVAHVPFVDVLNTMQDESLPLTPGEWPEWGNPITDKAAFEYIRSYSPYDNVSAQDYPPMLITGGLNDPRVTYWEPAKWTAKLRATKTDDNMLLMKINMGAGHGGKSGRWNRVQETAEEYAFILWQMGMAE